MLRTTRQDSVDIHPILHGHLKANNLEVYTSILISIKHGELAAGRVPPETDLQPDADPRRSQCLNAIHVRP